MDNRPTITIKLKPYLQEYLQCKINEPLTNSSKNIIGVILTPFIERIPADYIPKIEKGPDFIEIDLVNFDRLDIRGNCYVSEDNQRNFSRILDAHFKDVFYSYVDDKIRYEIVIDKKIRKIEIKKIILQFCADYHITFNNITYEMLKKSYYRHKIEQEENQKKNKLFYRKTSLCCPLIFLSL